MLHQPLIKDEEVTEGGGDEVQQVSANVGDEEEAGDLASRGILRPRRGVYVRRKDVVIRVFQHLIHCPAVNMDKCMAILKQAL